VRAFLVFLVVLTVMVLVGWITFSSNGKNQATITVDTEKIEKDTTGLAEKSGEAIEQVGKTVKEAVSQEQPSSEAPGE